MTPRRLRAAIATGILAFTWYALSAVQAQTAGAPLLAGISALLLLLVLRAVTVAARRRARRG